MSDTLAVNFILTGNAEKLKSALEQTKNSFKNLASGIGADSEKLKQAIVKPLVEAHKQATQELQKALAVRQAILKNASKVEANILGQVKGLVDGGLSTSQIRAQQVGQFTLGNFLPANFDKSNIERRRVLVKRALEEVFRLIAADVKEIQKKQGDAAKTGAVIADFEKFLSSALPVPTGSFVASNRERIKAALAKGRLELEKLVREATSERADVRGAKNLFAKNDPFGGIVTGTLIQREKELTDLIAKGNAELGIATTQEKERASVVKQTADAKKKADKEAADEKRRLDKEERDREKQQAAEKRQLARQRRDAERDAARQAREEAKKPSQTALAIAGLDNTSAFRLEQIIDSARRKQQLLAEQLRAGLQNREELERRVSSARLTGDEAALAAEKQRLSEINQEISRLEQLLSVSKAVEGQARAAITSQSNVSAGGIRTLTERGFAPKSLAGLGKADLKTERAELRQILTGIDSDLRNKLNDISKAGSKPVQIRGLKSAVKELRDQKAEVKKQLSEVNQALIGTATPGGAQPNPFLERIKAAIGIGAGATLIFGFFSRLKSEIHDAIQTAAEFQKFETSFIAILSEPIVERRGKVTLDTLQSLRTESKRIFQDAQIAAVQTVATTQQYVQALQSALAVGQQIGLSQTQVELITKRMVLAAGAFGIEFEKVGPSIAQILTGTVRVTNQLARNLGLATGEQRKLLKEAIKTGTVFDFLEKKTRSFGDTAKLVEDNFLNVSASIRDIVQLGGTQAISPVFTELNKFLIQLRDRFITDNPLRPFSLEFEQIIQQVQQGFVRLVPVIHALLTEIVNTFSAFGKAGLGSGTFSPLAFLLRTLTALLVVLRRIGPALLVLFGIKSLISIIGQVATSLTNFSLRATFATVAMKAMQAGATQTGAAVAGFGAAVNRALGWIGLALTVVTLLVTAVQELSGANDKARFSEEQLTDAYQKSEEALTKQAKALDLVRRIQEFTDLAKTKDKTREQREEFELLRASLLRLLPEVTVKQLELGKVTQKGFDDIRKGMQAEAELAAQRLKNAEAVVNATKQQFDFTTISAENAIAFLDKLKSRQNDLQNLLKGVGDAEEEKKFRAELEKVNKGIEDTTALLKQVANEADVPFELATQDTQKFLAMIERTLPALQQYVELAQFQSRTFDEQVDILVRNQDEQQRLQNVIRESNKVTNETVEAANRLKDLDRISAQEKELLRSTIELLTEVSGKNRAEIVKGAIANEQAALAAKEKALADLKAAEAANTYNAALIQINPQLATNAIFALAQQAAIEKDIDRIKAKIELFQTLLSKPFKPASTGGKTPKGRDELSDFLKETERQLGLLKKTRELLEKEVDRIVEKKISLIRALGDAGVVPFQQSVRVEQDLIERASDIKNRLARDVRDLLDSNLELAKAVAREQQGRDRRKDKAGTDTRNRQNEAVERIATERIDTFIKDVEELRRAQDKLTESATRGANQRISLIKKEIELNDELVVGAKQDAASLAEFQAKFGILGVSDEITAQFNARKAERDAQVKELTRLVDPFTDPKIREEILRADAVVSEEFNKILDPAERKKLFDDFQGSVQKIESLKNRLKAINDERISKGKKVDVSAQRQALEKDLQATTEALSGIGARLDLDAEKTKQLADATAVLLSTKASEEEKAQARVKLAEIEAETKKDELKTQIELFEFSQRQLQLQAEFLNFDKQRLDTLVGIVEKQKEYGVISEQTARTQTASLLQERITLLEREKAVEQERLATSTANLNRLKGGAAGNPEVAQAQLQIGQQINSITGEIFELKNRLFELTNPLFLAAQGLRQVADAIRSIPDPEFDSFAGKFKNLPFNKLGGVFDGLARLFDVLSSRQRPKTPAEEILTAAQSVDKAGQRFGETTVSAAVKFYEIIVAAGRHIAAIQSGEKPPAGGGASDGIIDVPPLNPGVIEPGKQAVLKKVGAFAVKALNAAATLIQGFASGDAGQIVSSIGQAIGQFGGPVGKAVGAVVETVGGIISFFGARARQKTKEMAEAISKGIQDLKDQISSGAISLGDGIRQLQQKLADAQRQLSGRKGGKDELKKIQDDVNNEIKQLRAQAKKTQDDFREALALLKVPKELRDVTSQISDIAKKTKEFLQSFENPAEAQAALADAIDFIRRSIQDLTDEIEKNMKDLQADLKKAGQDFVKSRQDILRQGRADDRISEAENKRRQLIDLEKQFREQQKSLQDQISAEQKKLDYVKQREKAELEIAETVNQSAKALGVAADKFIIAAEAVRQITSGAAFRPQQAYDQVFRQLAATNFTALATVNNLSVPQQPVELHLYLDGAKVAQQTIGVDERKHIELRGLISPNRAPLYRPVSRRD